jgi:hypothetical protein
VQKIIISNCIIVPLCACLTTIFFKASFPVTSHKYRDLALQVGGVSNETVKYGHEFCGTSTQESLLWQGPEAIVQVNYRTILLSERVPHFKKPAIVRKKKIWSWAPDGSLTPRQTGQLTVSHKLTSISTSTWVVICNIGQFLWDNPYQSNVMTDGRSVSMSWCQVHYGTCD